MKTAKTVKQKDALDRIVGQFDKSCATQESLFGPDGLARTLAARFLVHERLRPRWTQPSGLKKYETIDKPREAVGLRGP